MSAFAIQVMTGKENNVKRLLDWVIDKNEQAKQWIKEVHTFSQTTQRLGKNGLGKKIERPIMPGYIFLEMNYRVDETNTTAHLPAELWHVIKNVPGVLKLFADGGQIIASELLADLFGKLDMHDQVEIAVEVPAVTVETYKLDAAEKAVRTSLNELNMAETPDEKREVEIELNQAIAAEQQLLQQEEKPEMGPVAVQLESLKQEDVKLSLLNKVKSILKYRKEIVRFPLQVFSHIVSMLMINGQQVVMMRESEFLATLLMEILRKDVRRD